MYDTAQLALSDAGLTIEDIDGIVVGSNDQFDGRSICGDDGVRPGRRRGSRPALDPVGLRARLRAGRTPGRVGTVSHATDRVLEPDRGLLAGRGAAAWGRPLLQPCAAAGRVVGARAAGGGTGERRARVCARSPRRWRRKTGGTGSAPIRRRPIRPAPGPARWPLTPEMTTAPVTGSVALVLASPDFRRRARPFRRGVAARHGMGDRGELPGRPRPCDRAGAGGRRAAGLRGGRHHRSERLRSTWPK